MRLKGCIQTLGVSNPFILMGTLWLSFAFGSCKKAADRNCWKSSGKQVELEVLLNDFSELEIYEHLSIKLIQDTVTKAIVKGGENLVGKINFQHNIQKLTISNDNKCRFLRYKNGRIHINLHYKELSELYFQGTDSLVASDTLTFNNLKITIKDGAGSIHLKVKGNTMNIENPHGWGDIHLAGTLRAIRLDMDGNGYFDTRNLFVTDSIAVLSKSSVLSLLGANTKKLKAELNGAGDIWYFGAPDILLKNEYGKGRLIAK
jgi:hypothetical protein